jgi:hypothetical protein
MLISWLLEYLGYWVTLIIVMAPVAVALGVQFPAGVQS